VIKKLKASGFILSNADCTIIAQAPKMAMHIEQMRKNLAADCNVPVESMNIKATTTEKLGFTGRQEGIAAQAVVLLIDN
jgi:2-C-methyl-D-erythritol 2,4-cyclodiphosphate synthase